MDDPELNDLIKKSWNEYKKFNHEKWLVQPSQPILWFGDKEEYEYSKTKIITVGLNPSLIEFPTSSPELRFKLSSEINAQEYQQSLNDYFKKHNSPYMKWFSSFENLLNGLDASYKYGSMNTVLHTDIGSILATNPTWNKLDKKIKYDLSKNGLEIWHDLARYLKPDIIILSAAKSWIKKIQFTRIDKIQIIYEIQITKEGKNRKKPVIIEGVWIDLKNKKTLLIYAPAAQKPISMLSNKDKFDAGNKIMQKYFEVMQCH